MKASASQAALLFLLVSVFVIPCLAEAEDAESLIIKAKGLKLSERVEWLRLGHYHPIVGLFGYKSEADDVRFFLNDNGKYDPDAELDSTIRAFVSNEPQNDGLEPVHCRFPARYKFLARELPG